MNEKLTAEGWNFARKGLGKLGNFKEAVDNMEDISEQFKAQLLADSTKGRNLRKKPRQSARCCYDGK